MIETLCIFAAGAAVFAVGVFTGATLWHRRQSGLPPVPSFTPASEADTVDMEPIEELERA